MKEKGAKYLAFGREEIHDPKMYDRDEEKWRGRRMGLHHKED